MSKLVWISVLLMGISSFALEDTLPKGAIRFKLTLGDTDASEYFNFRETRIVPALSNQNAEYNSQSGDFSIEYGLAHDLSLTLRSGYFSHELTAPAQSLKTSGTPHLYLGVKQRLNAPGSPIRILAETGIALPIDADETQPMPIGSESIDWFAIVSYGQDFYPTNGGFEMDIGYVLRTEAPANEVFFDTALKLKLFALGRLALRYHTTESTEDSGTDYAPTQYPNDRGYQTLSLGLHHDFNRVWTLGLSYQEVFKGHNSFDLEGWRLTIEWRRFGTSR